MMPSEIGSASVEDCIPLPVYDVEIPGRGRGDSITTHLKAESAIRRSLTRNFAGGNTQLLLVLDDNPVLHDEGCMLEGRDVFEWVSWDGNDVG